MSQIKKEKFDGEVEDMSGESSKRIAMVRKSTQKFGRMARQMQMLAEKSIVMQRRKADIKAEIEDLRFKNVRVLDYVQSVDATQQQLHQQRNCLQRKTPKLHQINLVLSSQIKHVQSQISENELHNEQRMLGIKQLRKEIQIEREASTALRDLMAQMKKELTSVERSNEALRAAVENSRKHLLYLENNYTTKCRHNDEFAHSLVLS